MKLLRNVRGMTLVEVLAAMGISIIGMAVLLQMVLGNKTHKSRVDRSILLKELLTYNTIEIKSLSVDDLPPPGTCLVRIYDLQLNFQQQTKVTSTNPLCGVSAPLDNQYQIIWEIKPGSEINAEFSSSGLKLPKYSNSLKEVIAHVRGYATGGGSYLVHNQITLFKR